METDYTLNLKLDMSKLSVIVTNSNYYNGGPVPYTFTGDDVKRKKFCSKLNKLNNKLYIALFSTYGDSDSYDVYDQTKCGLHPEMQIVLAESIIVQFKVDNVCRVILCNNPYLLNGIEAYAEKYDVVDKIDWYLQVGDTKLKKVKKRHTDLLYRPLVAPLEILDSIPYEDDINSITMK